MKRKTLLLMALPFMWLVGCSKDNGAGGGGEGPGPDVPPAEKYVEIPDEAFSKFLLKQFDTDRDGRLSVSEAEAVRVIVVNGAWDIKSVEGLENFPNLIRFEMCGDFENTRPVKEVNVSANPLLETLLLSRNTISAIDVSKNTALKELDLSWNKVEAIDVSANPLLEVLRLIKNSLTSIDVSSNAALKELCISSNEIADLDLSGNPALEILDCGSSLISSIDVSSHAQLKKLSIGTTTISSIDVTRNAQLEELNVVSCGLTSLDLSGNPLLTQLYAGLNKFTELDLSGCASKMKGAACAGNPDLKTIYLRRGQKVESLLKDDTAEVVIKD